MAKHSWFVEVLPSQDWRSRIKSVFNSLTPVLDVPLNADSQSSFFRGMTAPHQFPYMALSGTTMQDPTRPVIPWCTLVECSILKHVGRAVSLDQARWIGEEMERCQFAVMRHGQVLSDRAR